MHKKIIGVFGGGAVKKDSLEWHTAEDIGRLLALHNCILLTGGLGGVMTAASQGAFEAGGITIGILPGDRTTSHPNKYVHIPIYTGMGEARNIINVKSCNAAIAIGGEYGTLSEIALALKTKCPLILINSWSFSRNLIEKHDWYTAENAEDAVQKALNTAK